MSRPDRRGCGIAISGMGTVLPKAPSLAHAWTNLMEKRCVVDTVKYTGMDGQARTALASRVTDFDYRRYLPDLPEKRAQKYSRDILMTMSAADMAMRDAGLLEESLPLLAGVDPERVSIYASSSRGPTDWWHQQYVNASSSGGAPSIRNGVLASMAGTPATMTAIRLGATGEVLTLSNACIGGNQALHLGKTSIESGQADVAVVIGHEFPIVPGVLDIYTSERSRVLSQNVMDPHRAMKPYDVRRDGFVIGEGAVVLVLESIDRVRARGREPYAVIDDVLSFSEAAHPTRMDTTGAAMADRVERLLKRNGKTAKHIQYVCGHGSATRLNDVAEARTLTRLYGPDPGASPPLTSVKPVFGHLLGASALVNCMATAMMIKKQILAPTANCAEPDPECPQDHVTARPRAAQVEHALSFAFGIGSLSSVALLQTAEA